MQRSMALRALHDIAVQIPAGTAGAQAGPAWAAAPAVPAEFTDLTELLAGLDDDEQMDAAPFPERRDMTGLRGRRSDDRTVLAGAAVYDEFEQRRSEYQSWVRAWADDSAASSPTPGPTPSWIQTVRRSS
jgi:hypothetical protein